MSTVRLIASGKGGVGKSTVTANLGLAMGRMGRRVCVIDMDIGQRDLDLVLGLADAVVYDLMDVVCKGCAPSLALLQVPGAEQVYLLPAAQFAKARDLDPKALRKVIRRLREQFDEILLDCPAGVERWVRNAAACEPDEALLVVTPDDVCLRDAQRMADVLRHKEVTALRLLVNRLMPDLVREGAMMSARQTAAVLDIPLAGEIPEDPAVYRALLTHTSLTDTDTPAGQAFGRIARRLGGEEVPFPDHSARKPGWLRRLFSSRR